MKGRRAVAEAEEKSEAQGGVVAAVKLEEVATVLRLISLAAAISIAEGKEGDEAQQEKEPTELYFFVVVHTMMVATAVVFSAGCLEGWSKDMEEFFRRNQRSLSVPKSPWRT